MKVRQASVGAEIQPLDAGFQGGERLASDPQDPDPSPEVENGEPVPVRDEVAEVSRYREALPARLQVPAMDPVRPHPDQDAGCRKKGEPRPLDLRSGPGGDLDHHFARQPLS